MMTRRAMGRVLGLCGVGVMARGCALLGVVANSVPKMVRAKYVGMKGQSVGVMAWADRGVRTDWPGIQLDISAGVQRKLQAQAFEKKIRDLEGVSFPVDARSIVRYQQDYPQIEGMNVEDVAPKMGVSRLIYVELGAFQTRSDVSLELFKGNAVATVKVVEVTPDPATGKKVGKAAFELGDVSVIFPKKGPAEGTTGLNDYAVYAGTVDALTTAIAELFYEHEEE